MDEAAHAAYVVASGGSKAEHADQSAVAAVQGGTANATDFGVAAGISIAVCFLAYLAIKAGIHERRDAIALQKTLKVHRRALLNMLIANHALEKAAAEKILLLIKHKAQNSSTQEQLKEYRAILNNNALSLQERLNQVQDAFGIANLDQHIGEMSFVSGSAILLKTLVEIANSISIAATGQFDLAQALTQGLVNTGLATSTTVLGSVAALGIGPIAAFGAMGLGIFFVDKTRRQAKAWKKNIRLVQKNLEEPRALLKIWKKNPQYLEHKIADADYTDSLRYLDFIDAKLQHRKKFSQTFLKWNIGFLAGSTLYGGATVTKAALVGISLAGVAAAANPVGASALLGVTLAAGILMVICSQQFLLMHDIQKRYDGYAFQDHHALDRHFLAAIDLYHPEGTFGGVQLRSSLYKSMTQQNRLVQNFLQTAATDMGRQHQWQPHVAAIEKSEAPSSYAYSKRKALRKNLQARLLANQAFLKRLIEHPNLKAARAARENKRADKQADLNQTKLCAWLDREWLDQDSTEVQQAALMRQVLRKRLDYLKLKNETRTAVWGDMPVDLEVAINVNSARDQALALEIKMLITELNNVKNIYHEGDPKNLLKKVNWNEYKERFLTIQKGAVWNGDYRPETLNPRFAKWLLNENKEFSDRRGILIETEIEAAKLSTKKMRSAVADPIFFEASKNLSDQGVLLASASPNVSGRESPNVSRNGRRIALTE